MSRTHGRADTYVDDVLSWPESIITEQTTVGRLTVKARTEHPSAWATVLTLTGVVYVGQSNGAQRWTGLNEAGDEVTVTRVPRRGGCSSCGR